MAGPPRCQMILKTKDVEAAHALVRAVLGETGYEDLRTRRSDNGFEVTGIRGKSTMAMMFQLIPFGRALGIASRTRVRASCQRSLSDGDDRLHVYLRIPPVKMVAGWDAATPDGFVFSPKMPGEEDLEGLSPPPPAP